VVEVLLGPYYSGYSDRSTLSQYGVKVTLKRPPRLLICDQKSERRIRVDASEHSPAWTSFTCTHDSKRAPDWISAGRSGACEARLYLFASVAYGDGEQPVTRVAACYVPEAIAYWRKWHSDLDIQHTQLVAVIEMLSGSPLN